MCGLQRTDLDGGAVGVAAKPGVMPLTLAQLGAVTADATDVYFVSTVTPNPSEICRFAR